MFLHLEIVFSCTKTLEFTVPFPINIYLAENLTAVYVCDFRAKPALVQSWMYTNR